jgi:acetyl esterase
MAKQTATSDTGSSTLIDKFLINSQTHTNAKVLSVATASNSGLDDKTKEALEFIHSLTPVYELELESVRKNRENPYEHDSANGVNKHDICIPCQNHKLAARVYRPELSGNDVLPALIYFHGGGFVLGDIKSHDKMLTQLCSQSSIAIISVAYRLAPETKFPAAIDDALASTDWIANNSKNLNINSQKIAIGGDSAGANLATVYCHLNKDRSDFRPLFQLLIYPSIIGNNMSESRRLFSEKLLLTKELLHWFHELYISPEEADDPRFNVMNFDDFSHLPPAFILTCGFDPLRDEGQLYGNKLKDSGVTVKHSCYTDMFHGFINFGKLQQSKDAVTECATVLKGVMDIK